jgi:hypothetical protein
MKVVDFAFDQSLPFFSCLKLSIFTDVAMLTSLCYRLDNLGPLLLLKALQLGAQTIISFPSYGKAIHG